MPQSSNLKLISFIVIARIQKNFSTFQFCIFPKAKWILPFLQFTDTLFCTQNNQTTAIFFHLSVSFLSMRYLRNTIMKFLQNGHNHQLELKDELITFPWWKVKGQGHWDLMSLPFSSTWYLEWTWLRLIKTST